ncbi:MAG: hypothetical protein ABI595_15800 [Actinomycetota bacterium]
MLKAELPHLWPHIEKFVGGKTEYSDRAIRQLLGSRPDAVITDLVNIGLLEALRGSSGRISYRIPFLYRSGLDLSQGRQQ